MLMRHIGLLPALLLLVAAAPDSAPPAPNWMAGAWEQADDKGWSDEFWTGMRGTVMLGAARSGKGAVSDFWEQTRIERNTDGSLTFWASPRGAAGAAFPMVAQSERMIEFASTAHDYPQRIRYWREGKQLRARISLIDGSKAVDWTYQPMGD